MDAKPVSVIEDSKHGVFAPKGQPNYTGGAYWKGMIPAGQTVEVVVLVDGVERERKTCVAAPQEGCNFVAAVRITAFDSSKAETLKPKPLGGLL